jgi:aryl-alcohol dehydrogenase-like predicted oxidoreductase
MSSASFPRLALGTAQFGMAYGVMNNRGCAVPTDEVAKILDLAWRSGVDLLDTAPAYGEAESVLSGALSLQSSFGIVSKVSTLGDTDRLDPSRIVDEINQSRARMGTAAFHGVLVHHAPDFLSASGPLLFGVLSRLRDAGVTRRIGVSVYDPKTLVEIVDRFPIDIVQLPLNVFDQRFVREGTIERLKERGIEVHVRSVFLQGVLVAEIKNLPNRFSAARDKIMAYDAGRKRAGLSRVASAFHFVMQCPGVDRIVIGVDSLINLQDDLRGYEEVCRWQGDIDYAPYMIDDPNIVDPRRWTEVAPRS